MIDVAFESVIDLGAKLSATIVQTEPGMGCFVTADIGHPMHMIAIPNKTAKYGWANKQVDVTVKKVVIDCE